MKKCAYVNCLGVSDTRFQFPVYDVLRAKKWQINCGNKDIADLDVIELRRLVLCEAHFPPGFIITSAKKKTLWKDAVPYKWDEIPKSENEDEQEEEEEEAPIRHDPAQIIRTYQLKRGRDELSNSSDAEMESDLRTIDSKSSNVSGSEDSTRIKLSGSTRKTFKIKKTKMKCGIFYQTKYKSRKPQKSFSNFTIVNNLLKWSSNSVKTFVKMQIFRNSHWTNSEKQLALAIFHKSPSAYQYFLENLKFRLPSLKTIQSWLKVINLKTGMSTSFRSKLAYKAKSMSEEEKLCVVMFDEIPLKKKCEYNAAMDVIEGYQDLGQLGREDVIADTGLVFFLRGLIFNWKLPLCYYISSGTVKGSSLKYIIEYIIRHLRAMTFDPKVLVCCENPNTRTALSFLGATQEEPVIAVDNENVFICFDVPNLIKSLRDDFMKTHLNFMVNKNRVSWNDIVHTYRIDKERMSHIRDSHINPNNIEKKRIKYAVEIFSGEVASAITTLVQMNQFVSYTALDTADFIQNVHSVYEALNTKVIHDKNSKKSALSIYDETTEQVLLNALHYFDNIEVFEQNKKTETLHSSKGLTWTIRSILLLWGELQDLGIEYLLTSCLNQEPLQIFLNNMKGYSGYNPLPTVRQCRQAMQTYMNQSLQMVTTTSYCFMDEIDLVDSSRSEQFLDEHEYVISDDEIVDKEDDSQNIEDAPSTSKENTPLLDTCSSTYIAAYLIMNHLRQTHCEQCIATLKTNSEDLVEPKETNLLHKNYGCPLPIRDLKKTTDQFIEIVSMSQRLFNLIYKKHKFDSNVREKIQDEIVNLLMNSTPVYSFWLKENPECVVHRKGIIGELIKMKIYRTIQWELEMTGRKPSGHMPDAKRQRKM